MSAVAFVRHTPAPSLAAVRTDIEHEFTFSAADDRQIIELRRAGRLLPEIAEALDRDVDLVGARLVLLAHFGLMEVRP